jgi:hypothetical protein
MDKHYIQFEDEIVNPLQVTSITKQNGYRSGKNDRRILWYNKRLAESNHNRFVKWWKTVDTVFYWSKWHPPRVTFWDGNKPIRRISCKSNAEMERVYSEYVYIWNSKIDRFAKELRE